MAISLQDFAASRRTGGGLPQAQAPLGAGSSLSDFASRRAVTNTIVGATEVVTKPIGNTLRAIGKQLMKPVGLLATAAETTGSLLGGRPEEFGRLSRQAVDIVTGKQEYSFTDLWTKSLPNNPGAALAIGTVSDLVADPLNFLTGGPKVISIAPTVGKITAKVPGLNKAVETTRKLFSTATKNKEFDAVARHFKDLGDFRRVEIIEDAKRLQKTIIKLEPADVTKISNSIEKGVAIGDKALDTVATDISSIYSKWKTIEKELGIPGGEIAGYLPHISVDKPTNLLGKLRQWSSRLGGAEKSRSVLKFVAEDGSELVGKADNLGLKQVAAGFKDKSGKIYQSTQATIEEINTAFGKKFFEENPAIQMAHRGLAHTRAVTGKEFFQSIKKFASKEGVLTTVPDLQNLKFDEDIARAIDTYYESIRPEGLNAFLNTFDGVQNWWKAQALVAPAYHTRNAVSNLWNAFLAGVKTPLDYVQAGLMQTGKDVKIVDKAGRVWDTKATVDAARRNGVLNEGWYAKDIPTAIEAELTKGNWNLFSNSNEAFKANRAVGSAIENNARLAVFINRLKAGESVSQASMTVKKFLFDYDDLTRFEKNVMKRIFPFYTWTRKNIPLQLENLIKQPGKYAGLEKVVRAIENISLANTKPADEKYLSDYIENNTAMRVGYDKETDTYYYFLLGNWMPSYQAVDFLAQPLTNLMQMVTPLIKTPIEVLANRSSFFKNTLGQYDVIERYPGDSVNFLGFSMPKRTAAVLRNIRLLNELDKLNPGLIFGGQKGQPSVFSKANFPAGQVPGMGFISPATQKYSGRTPIPTAGARFSALLVGKLASYTPNQARQFYNMDTQSKVEELITQIKKARQNGEKAKADALVEQLNAFQEERR